MLFWLTCHKSLQLLWLNKFTEDNFSKFQAKLKKITFLNFWKEEKPVQKSMQSQPAADFLSLFTAVFGIRQ